MMHWYTPERLHQYLSLDRFQHSWEDSRSLSRLLQMHSWGHHHTLQSPHQHHSWPSLHQLQHLMKLPSLNHVICGLTLNILQMCSLSRLQLHQMHSWGHHHTLQSPHQHHSWPSLHQLQHLMKLPSLNHVICRLTLSRL